MKHGPHYKPETAGSLMLKTVPVGNPQTTATQALELLKEQAGNFETLDYLYITDGQGVLKGTATIKSILQADPTASLADIMESDLVTVHGQDDQETVARLALNRQLKAVPVVDNNQKLLGVVPSHVILNVLEAEHEEDALLAAGVPTHTLNQQQQNISAQARHRLPWLIIGMAGGLVAAIMIEAFEEALAEEVLLAAFIPTLVYLADAAGVQVQTLYIRLMSRTNQIKTAAYMAKEVATSMIVAAVLGVCMLVLVSVWFEAHRLALIVAISVTTTVIFAGLVAVVLPWLFYRLKRDPAVASGPMSTIIIDVVSIVIYFTIASRLLHVF